MANENGGPIILSLPHGLLNIALDIVCPVCQGKKREDLPGINQDCPECEGMGTILTPAGEALLNLAYRYHIRDLEHRVVMLEKELETDTDDE